MYSIRRQSGQLLKSAEIQRELNTIDDPQAFRHLCDIEHLEARGMRYSNQDIDVLGSALAYLDRHKQAVQA